MSFVVAIDGTAGSGKGTVAKLLSEKYNLCNIDTGATYRCLSLAVLENNVDIKNKESIIKILEDIDINIKGTNSNPVFLLNGIDVSDKIRSKEVTQIVSQISSIPEVRIKLVDLQRKLAKNKNVILDGRDIGTYVFPNADVKIYLDASVEKRAERRFAENIEKGIETSFEQVLENIRMRDKQDMEKQIGALKIADDAIVVDTSNLSIEEVVLKISKIIEEKLVKE